MSIPRRYRDVLHKLREREVWLVDELPHECNAETLTYFDQKGLISWRFVTWSNQGQGKPPLAERTGWNAPSITIDRTGDSWERQLAQRRTDGLHPTELKVSPHGHSVLTELAAADSDAQVAENERRLQEESRQASILAATIRASVRENPALMDAIREATTEVHSIASSMPVEMCSDTSHLSHDELDELMKRPFVILDAAGNATRWARLDERTRLIAALHSIGGVYDTGASEPIVPFPSDPAATDKRVPGEPLVSGHVPGTYLPPVATLAWKMWLQRLWVADEWRYRETLRGGYQASVPFVARHSRSSRTLEDVWHYVQREFAVQDNAPQIPERLSEPATVPYELPADTIILRIIDFYGSKVTYSKIRDCTFYDEQIMPGQHKIRERLKVLEAHDVIRDMNTNLEKADSKTRSRAYLLTKFGKSELARLDARSDAPPYHTKGSKSK